MSIIFVMCFLIFSPSLTFAFNFVYDIFYYLEVLSFLLSKLFIITFMALTFYVMKIKLEDKIWNITKY